MKIVIMLFAFIPLLFSCNAKGNPELLEVAQNQSEIKSDSIRIVDGDVSWKKLFSLNNSVKEQTKIGNRDTVVSETKVLNKKESTLKEVTLGAGCFWCIEACFLDIKGVVSIVPGYAGGKTVNPTYEQVCTGSTGHAEVARIVYDESLISFDELLEMFWFVHDPTQLNRQGNDVGTQYRSVIFYHTEEQKVIAEKYKTKLIENKVWDKPVVTEITPINNYYEAEKYHHNYLEQNPDNAYCKAIVRPKVDKFKKVFSSKIK